MPRYLVTVTAYGTFTIDADSDEEAAFRAESLTRGGSFAVEDWHDCEVDDIERQDD